jgi:hypothetical protein
MIPHLGAELELRRRRDLDRLATEGATRQRWMLEAREARSGAKRPVAGVAIVWALPDWKPTWKTEEGTT